MQGSMVLFSLSISVLKRFDNFTLWVLKCATSRADSKFAPSQWETVLQSNAVSHWLGIGWTDNNELQLGILRNRDYYYYYYYIYI